MAWEEAMRIEYGPKVAIGTVYPSARLHVSGSTIGLFRLRPNGSGEADRVQVKLGLSSVNAVEIVSGLKEGDTVVLSDMSAWDSVDRVRLK